jgi:protein-arginine deiminase
LITATLPPKLDDIKTKIATLAPDATFVKVPALFLGNAIASGDDDIGAVAFTPNPVNLQQIDGALYVPRQFGPRDSTGDTMENKIKAQLTEGDLDFTVHFVDDWQSYHVSGGEVHCGTVAKRKILDDWWTLIGAADSVE